MAMPPICLSFSCIESTGGSSGVADIKAFTARGMYGTLVATGILSLGHAGSASAMALPDLYLRTQLESLPEWVEPAAVKVGLCASVDTVHTIARYLREHKNVPLVLDPVVVNHLGIPLVRPEVITAMQEQLLPRATVITPNRYEAAMLAGVEELLGKEDMEAAARTIFDTFGCPTLITGGSVLDNADVFCCMDGVTHFSSHGTDTHVYGSGTTLSAAITCELASGEALREAIPVAKAYVCSLIDEAPGNEHLKSGVGPLCHCLSAEPKHETSSWVRDLP